MNAPDLSRLMHLVRHGVFQATAVSSLLVATANQAMAQVKQHFDVEEFQVQGNTLLPAVDIEAVVYEFLGPAKTVDDVERARAALEALYAKRGYPTVSAELPAQSAADGVIVLKVTER